MEAFPRILVHYPEQQSSDSGYPAIESTRRYSDVKYRALDGAGTGHLRVHHSRSLLVAVPNVDPFYQKQHVFSDVRGVIGNALQVPHH